MNKNSSSDQPVVLLKEDPPGKVLFYNNQGGDIYLGIFLLAAGIYFPFSDYSNKTPLTQWVVTVLFVGMGIALILQGYNSQKTHSLCKKNKKRDPDKPWLWDLPWNPKETQNDFMGKGRGLVFLGTIAWVLWFQIFLDWPGRYKYLIILSASLVTILLLIYKHLIPRIIRSRNRSRDDRLSFDQFPFWTGEQFSGKLSGLPEDIEKLKLTLRLVVEHTFGDEDEGFYQVYQDTQTVGRGRLGSSGQLTVEWDLPAGSEFSTRLDKEPFQYWELEAKGEEPNQDYHARFLVPIYSKVPPTKEEMKIFKRRIKSTYVSVYEEE